LTDLVRLIIQLSWAKSTTHLFLEVKNLFVQFLSEKCSNTYGSRQHEVRPKKINQPVSSDQ